jgi:hypothetical protein
MCASPAPERLDGFYSYSVIKNLSVIARCPVNMNLKSCMNILAPKNGALSDGLLKQNGDFLENCSENFD